MFFPHRERRVHILKYVIGCALFSTKIFQIQVQDKMNFSFTLLILCMSKQYQYWSCMNNYCMCVHYLNTGYQLVMLIGLLISELNSFR